MRFSAVRARDPAGPEPAEAGRARFLLCPPDFFDTHFLFNPFMGYREKVNLRVADRQWRKLNRALKTAGASVELVEPLPATSATTFTADGAFCLGPGRALVLRNDGPRGDLEPPVFRDWLQSLGYQTEALPPSYRLDGGNLLRLGDGTVLAGLKPGASGLGERYLARLLALTTGERLQTVELVDNRYLHLDTAVGVLRPDLFVVYRAALAGGKLPAEGPLASGEIIDVDADDARRFACNTVVVGDVVITGPVSDGLAGRIASHGFRVERVDLSEFYKAGGGAKCLTLPLSA